jgi:hypothetical protein
VLIRVHPWLKIQTPIAPIVHPKMNTGKEFRPPSADFGARQVTHAEFGMQIFLKFRQDEQDLQDSGRIILTILPSCLKSRFSRF